MATRRVPPMIEKQQQQVEAAKEAEAAVTLKQSDDGKKKFEELWKDENELKEAQAVQEYLESMKGKKDCPAEAEEADSDSKTAQPEAFETPIHTPEKEGENDELAQTAKRCNKSISTAKSTDVPNEDKDNSAEVDGADSAVGTASRGEDGEEEEEDDKSRKLKSEEGGDSPSEQVVDWVPEKKAEETKDDGDDDDTQDNRILPLPTTLETTFQEANQSSASNSVGDGCSVSSSVSGSNALRRGESARRKKSSNWASSNSLDASSLSDANSVTSTDSSKFRRLLGQNDTNDAALVFGTQKSQNKVETSSHTDSTSSSSSEADVSVSSRLSTQLKSLLARTESKDSADDNNSESLLFTETSMEEENCNFCDLQSITSTDRDLVDDIASRPVIFCQEEKKDDDFDDHDQQSAYQLPSSISPRHQEQQKRFRNGVISPTESDAESVTSALSEAPSVDASISSKMGWF